MAVARMTDKRPKTRLEKAQIMYELFGKDEKHVCRDCIHRKTYEYSKTYAKCEVFSTSHSQQTDWGSLQCACGLFNKPTEKRDIFIESGFYNSRRRKHEELQSETLF